MIMIKTSRELEWMKQAGRIAARALKCGGEAVEPGVSTFEIDRLIRKTIEEAGATPSFLGYSGYPASACISVNSEVIHGIPNRQRKIQEGDIVSIDVGAYFEGFHGDNAATFACGDISPQARDLIDVTRESLNKGIRAAVIGGRIGDIGNAIQRYVESRGYSVVRDFVGHGVGAKLHENPSVPNFGTPGRGVRLLKDMTIAIEPMINVGDWKVKILDDGWTTITADGSLSAHFEHSLAITDDGPMILTLPDDC